MGEIILAGDFIPCGMPTRTYRDTGLAFVPDVHRRIRRRYTKPDTLVWHWTGGEPKTAATTYKVLRARGLGVEFAIDRDGTIWQFCDPATVDARDCGSWWDRRSIGVEIVNYGSRFPASRRWSLRGVPKRGRERELVETHLRGRRVFVADFFDAQYEAAEALAEALRLVFLLPHEVPRDANGVILDRPMTREQELAWDGGEVGHLHITSRAKPDPGMPFMEWRERELGLV